MNAIPLSIPAVPPRSVATLEFTVQPSNGGYLYSFTFYGVSGENYGFFVYGDSATSSPWTSQSTLISAPPGPFNGVSTVSGSNNGISEIIIIELIETGPYFTPTSGACFAATPKGESP